MVYCNSSPDQIGKMNIQKPHLKKFQATRLLITTIFSAALILTACGGSPTPSADAQIRAAVAATLSALPSASPYPSPMIFASATPFSIDNLFCEYGFCIGHPAELYLVDQGATRQPPLASVNGYGILFGYSQSLFIEIAWTTSNPNFDPQQTMQLILEEQENLQGSLQAQLYGKYNVYYQPITTITSSLPFGYIAAWQCGGRDFVWKAYAAQESQLPGLLNQAIEKFRCQADQ